jgi:hypothetical protein
VRIEAMDLDPEVFATSTDENFACTTDLHQDSLAVQTSFE